MNELLAPRTPGAALKAAREQRGLTLAEVVEATRIKAHIIEALENDDYSEIAAPLYGKGFIKLYAEHVGLDPAPLIQRYLSQYARTPRPTLQTEIPPPAVINDGIPQPSPLARFKESGGVGRGMPRLANSIVMTARDVLHALSGVVTKIQTSGRELSRAGMNRTAEAGEPMPVGRYAALGFAALVVILLMVGAVTFMIGGREAPAPAPVPPKAAERNVGTSRPLRLATPPPAPYLKLK